MTNELPEQQTEINYLHKLFGEESDVTLDDIWRNAGRTDKSYKTNMHWLYNVLVGLSSRGYIAKSYDGRKLKRIKLTDAGKKVLGRDLMEWADAQPAQTNIVANTEDTEELLERVNRDIEVLQQKLPSFYITFNIRPRRDVGMSERVQRTLRKL